MRVRQVVNELRGEKVDIVPFNDNPSEFVMKALAPARVREVRIHEDTGIAEVIVPDFQLSLAIGKEGQNARLAARLTGWRVDIKSETQLAEEEAGGGVEEDYAEGEWITTDSGELMFQPAGGGDAISAAEAGYATLATGADPDEVPDSEGVTEITPAGGEERVVPAAEEAAIHIEDDAEDIAADELASDADLSAEDPDVLIEAEELIEEHPGQPAEVKANGEEGDS
jgi:N utilization substance protein A